MRTFPSHRQPCIILLLLTAALAGADPCRPFPTVVTFDDDESVTLGTGYHIADSSLKILPKGGIDAGPCLRLTFTANQEITSHFATVIANLPPTRFSAWREFSLALRWPDDSATQVAVEACTAAGDRVAIWTFTPSRATEWRRLTPDQGRLLRNHQRPPCLPYRTRPLPRLDPPHQTQRHRRHPPRRLPPASVPRPRRSRRPD